MSLPVRRGRQVLKEAELIQAALAEVQARPLEKPRKSRLFRLPRSVLSSSFYSGHTAPILASASTSLFSLFLRPLSSDVVQNINDGPHWLRGAYPPGTLHQRHEKRRLINIIPPTVWRSGEESEEDLKQMEEKEEMLKRLRVPLLQKSSVDNDRIPTVIITSKKKIDKRATVRFAVSRKLWSAFDEAVNQLQGSPSEVPKNSTVAYTFMANETVISATKTHLIGELVKVLKTITSKATRKADKLDKKPQRTFRR